MNLGPHIDFRSRKWKKKHRTCLIVEIGETSSESFRNRIKRLIQTLLQDTSIRVDAFRSFEGMLEIYSEQHLGKAGLDQWQTDEDYNTFAVSQGYDCLIIAREPKLTGDSHEAEIAQVLADHS